jgi:WD40 repeat protein
MSRQHRSSTSTAQSRHQSVTAQVWDLKTGQLLRTQTVHRGMVTCLAYTTSAKLLFSGSIDGSIGVWTDKGNLLQVITS